MSSLEQCDGQVAVLADGSADVYNKSLTHCTRYEAPGAVRLMLRDDGSVLAVGAYSAAVLTEPIAAQETEEDGDASLD